MIYNFADKRTEQIFDGQLLRRLDTELQRKVLRRLRYIDATNDIKDLMVPPSNRLEKLQGNLKDFYSIRVNSQWRIIFKWVDGNAQDVKFTDYH